MAKILQLQGGQAEGTCMDKELLSFPLGNRWTAQQKDVVWT